MNINFHPPKWTIYVSIIVFVAIFGLTLMKVIGDEVNQHAEKKINEAEQTAKENILKSDSVAKVADKKFDSVVKEMQSDSIEYAKKQTQFRFKQAEIIKGYEAKVARIDTMPADELDGYLSRRLSEEDNDR